MSLAELQSWLLENGIRDDLNKLTRLTVRNELDNLAPEESSDSAESIDWARLLLAGSILARSNEKGDQDAALRIATGAVLLAKGQALKDAGGVLMSKLSNFRAISLACVRKLVSADLDSRLGTALP